MSAYLDKLKEKLTAKVGTALTAADVETLVSDQELTTAMEEDFTEATTEATGGLVKKNAELLKEKKALQEKVKNGTKEELTDLEDRITKLSEENEKLTGTLVAKEKEFKTKLNKTEVDQKTLTTALESEKSRHNAIILENALSQGLSGVTMDKAMVNVVRSHLRNNLTIVEENGERKAVAVYKDKDNKDVSLPFKDYVDKVWAPSDEGKAFIKSQASGGAGTNKPGASGTQKNTGGNTDEGNAFSDLKFSE